MHMSKWNIASFSKDDQDKVSVDKAAAVVAWQERMKKPVGLSLLNGNSLNIFASISVNGLKFIGRTASSCRAQMRPNIINPEMSSRSDSYRQCVQGGSSMRMSLMFAAVTLLTGINLLFIPFQPE